MKKIIAATVCIIILLACIIGCTGAPAEEGVDAFITTPPAVSPTPNATWYEAMSTDYLPESENEGVLREGILFYDLQEYAEFVDSVMLDDEAFNKYIEEKGYYYNGIMDRDDAERVIDALNALPCGRSDSYIVDCVDVFFDHGNCLIMNTSKGTDGSGVHYVFVDFFHPENAETLLEEKLYELRTETTREVIEIENASELGFDRLYYAGWTVPSAPDGVGFDLYHAILGGRYCFIRISGMQGRSLEALATFTYTTLGEMISE